jgi:quinol monooxygenase YgiN
VKVLDIDPSCPLSAQVDQAGHGPVTVIVVVVAPGGITEEYMAAWQKESAFMRNQPGCISAQLYVGVGESKVTTTVAVWESADALEAAFANPGWRQALKLMPQDATAHPVLVRKVAVPGICIA